MTKNRQAGSATVILLTVGVAMFGLVAAMHFADILAMTFGKLALLAIVSLHIGLEQILGFTVAFNHLLTGKSDKPVPEWKGRWIDGLGSWAALVVLIVTGWLPQVVFGILLGDFLSHIGISSCSKLRKKGFWVPGIESVGLYAVVVVIGAVSGSVDFGSGGFLLGMGILLGNTAVTVLTARRYMETEDTC